MMRIKASELEGTLTKNDALMIAGFLINMALYVQPNGHCRVFDLGKDVGNHLIESGCFFPTTDNCSPSGHRNR